MKVLWVKEQIGGFQTDRKSTGTQLVAVGAERNKLNGELISQQTEVETLRVTLSPQAPFVQLWKERMAAKQHSFNRECKDFAKMLLGEVASKSGFDKDDGSKIPTERWSPSPIF